MKHGTAIRRLEESLSVYGQNQNGTAANEGEREAEAMKSIRESIAVLQEDAARTTESTENGGEDA